MPAFVCLFVIIIMFNGDFASRSVLVLNLPLCLVLNSCCSI